MSVIADDEVWVPQVNFVLDNGTYEETLWWISGSSYAYTSLAHDMAEAKIYCTKMVGSKDLLDILNTAYKGQKISSELAVATFRLKLPETFPCK